MLGILIIICLLLLILGVVKNYKKLSNNNFETDNIQIYEELFITKPKTVEITSSHTNNNNYVINFIENDKFFSIIIDYKTKKILKKIQISNGSDWGIK